MIVLAKLQEEALLYLSHAKGRKGVTSELILTFALEKQERKTRNL